MASSKDLDGKGNKGNSKISGYKKGKGKAKNKDSQAHDIKSKAIAINHGTAQKQKVIKTNINDDNNTCKIKNVNSASGDHDNLQCIQRESDPVRNFIDLTRNESTDDEAASKIQCIEDTM